MPDVREQAAVLTLVAASKGGWHRTASLLEEAGSALKILRQDWKGLDPLTVPEAEKLAASAVHSNVDKYVHLIEDLATAGVKLVTVLDVEYPSNLREIYNRPPMLFIKGPFLARDERAVAVVGTRAASRQGRQEARALASELASRGITVLSGLARGIDTEAHEGALDAGGRTIAVMGTGINRVYPAENEKLSERIRASGALVSQFWPDSPPRQTNFPLRNVVMSGMSIGTVVVEAGSTSGAKMQARLALDHGKRVFLLRSLVMKQQWAQKYSERPGAVVVDSADKIVDLVERLIRAPEQLTLA